MRCNTAILFYGVVHRSLPYTIDALREHLINPIQQAGCVDLFFHSWDNPEIHNPRGGEQHIPVYTGVVEQLLPEVIGRFDAPDQIKQALIPVVPMNPFTHCTDNAQDAYLCMENYLLGLESLRRAYELFLSTKDKHYDMVVISRPDVRYLQPVPIRPYPIDQRLIYLPMFHRYRGHNDRFAAGSEASIRVYCDRLGDARHRLLEGRFPYNTEHFLARYLHDSTIDVGLIDIVFQRIRADGSVFKLDEALAT